MKASASAQDHDAKKVLSKERNRMGFDKAEDYIYVRHNLNMLRWVQRIGHKKKVIKWTEGIEDEEEEDKENADQEKADAWEEAREVESVRADDDATDRRAIGMQRAARISSQACNRIAPAADPKEDEELEELEKAMEKAEEAGLNGKKECNKTRSGRVTRRPDELKF